MPRRKTNETILHKTYAFTVTETKEADERTGVIVGDANVYGIVDSVGDIVEAGAFKRSLKGDDVRPLLWQHDTYEVIGDGVFEETDNSLRLADGQLYKGVQRAEEAYEIAKQTRRPLGLSIGFSIASGGAYNDDDGIRHITEAKLYEVSLVTFPANAASMIDGVKAQPEEYESLAQSILDADLSLLADDDIADLLEAAVYLADALTPEVKDDEIIPTIAADDAAKMLQDAALALAALV
jgi:hypothetical protein